jgi:dihydrofolate reductase
MSRVFFSVTMSLDGCIAPAAMQPGRPTEEWLGDWMALQAWVFEQKFLRERLKLGEGGETGEDNRRLEATFARTGASILGKRMFDAGEHSWPEDAPFRTPVFVVTHTKRSPWVRPGGTTFYFVTDGIESALEQARAAAGDRDVRIGGGADLIRQYLAAGLVDEFTLALSPVLMSGGLRLFDGLDLHSVQLDLVRADHSTRVTHLTYAPRSSRTARAHRGESGARSVAEVAGIE